jgi:hypothetical protein
MIKHTTKYGSGTSFHGSTIKTTPRELKKLFPYSWRNGGDGKTNFDFTLEDGEGNIFTIYDWKYYRKLGEDEAIIWHIGAKSKFISDAAASELEIILRGKMD